MFEAFLVMLLPKLELGKERIVVLSGKAIGVWALTALIVATKASLPQRAADAMWERSPDHDFEV
ncbi:MAG: hypothetical protein CVV06_01170 [Gammaproteobacteria bacterium HGW-Gammaproteobacteria-10]|nr:MAG: hypothetical protein CVV06_01170 [Gammaproteobacteria bacterium HGW-Gammaproteobacteria-10]